MSAKLLAFERLRHRALRCRGYAEHHIGGASIPEELAAKSPEEVTLTLAEIDGADEILKSAVDGYNRATNSHIRFLGFKAYALKYGNPTDSVWGSISETSRLVAMWCDLAMTQISGLEEPMPSTTINIGSMQNSPLQYIAPRGHGVQNSTYHVTTNDLRAIVDLYRKHIDELNLDVTSRRKADSQIATIEAQLSDEPDPAIVTAAGRSLKTIVEGAIGGAMGNVLASPGVWAPLLALFR
ncbi:hypothetical protein AGR8A_pTi20130 [Agrobacterium fabrum str. J-07]|nr:hypothetical protein [Agrobacterium fabrum]CUX58710.1 hypothetical protein AGR8A_pTi20130 [Agrobacterium fabrum str. J-07]